MKAAVRDRYGPPEYVVRLADVDRPTATADRVLDYAEVDYTRTGTRYDWIVDTDSHHPIMRIRRALRGGGIYVTLGGEGDPSSPPFCSGRSSRWRPADTWA